MSIPIANDFAAIAANMRNDTSEMDAPGAGGPDAELLAMCIAFHRQNAAAQAVRSRDDDALLDAMDRRWEISDEIQNIPATTEAGRIAKALVAIVLLRESDLFRSGATTFAFATLLNVAGIDLAVTSDAGAQLRLRDHALQCPSSWRISRHTVASQGTRPCPPDRTFPIDF